MPVKPQAILESPDDGGLGELNDEYHGGQWAVVHLASLQSLPLSDYSHTPYGQDSAFLDTFSVSAVSGVPSTRLAAAQFDTTSVSPIANTLSRKLAAQQPPPEHSSSKLPLFARGDKSHVAMSSTVAPHNATAVTSTEHESESGHVVAALVRRELTKQLVAETPSNSNGAGDASHLTTDKPPLGHAKPTVSPRSLRRRRSIEANQRTVAALGDGVVSPAVAREAPAKPHPTNARTCAQQATISQEESPAKRPALPPATVRPLACTVDNPQLHSRSYDLPSPVVALSMRELTNARKMPVSGDNEETDGVCASTSRPPTASVSSLSVLSESKATKAKSTRPTRRWMNATSPSRACAGEPQSGRGPTRLAEFSPISSQREDAAQSDTKGPESAISAPDRSSTAVAEKQHSGGDPVGRRTSRRTSVNNPSAMPAVESLPPRQEGHRRLSNSNAGSEASPSTSNSVSFGRARRMPLCPPLSAVATAATLAANNADLQAAAVTPTAKERAATASQERLTAFVRAVSDPEVLHVIHDYLCERKESARQYREAARICEELLEKKEKLLEENGVRPRSRSAYGRKRRVNRALLAGEEDEKDGETAAGNGLGADDLEAKGLADEFDDLNVTDSAYPEEHSQFQFGEPTVMGTVSRVFKDGLLFMIKDSKGDYYFYNDTLNQVMMVRAQCVLRGNERINERALAIPCENDHGVTEITIAVLPEETNFFMGNCKRFPRVMAKAIVTPDDFTSPSVTSFMKHMNGEINQVRAALGQWSKATDQKAYLKCCLKKKLKFTDLDFRPCAHSLFRPQEDVVKIPPLTWRRPEEYLAFTEVAEARLFRGEISCHLVQQGELSNHTVVAAIAAIAQCPHFVMWMFRHPLHGEIGKRERHIGCYRVTLLKNGWWTNFIVDDYVPASAKGPLFARCPADPRRLWVPLLEKAYAKALGSYSAMCVVDVLDVLADFTGFPTRSVDLLWQQAQAKPTESPSVSLFRYLQRCVANGYLVLVYTHGVGDRKSADTLDLTRKRSQRMIPVDGALPQFLPGHVYFLSDAALYKELDLRMVRLKNPWTWEAANHTSGGPTAASAAVQKRWKYTGWYERPDQSFTSTMSTASTAVPGAGKTSALVRTLEAQALAEEEERKGTMWLEWTEALEMFAGGGVCYTLWHHLHYRVQNSFGNGFPDFVLEVTPVKTKIELFLSMTMEAPGEPAPAEAKKGAAEKEATVSRKQSPCGITLTVSRRVQRMGIAVSRPSKSDSEEEEVCAIACEDVEAVAAKTTYVRAKTVSLKVTLEPNGAPYHIIPRIDPEDAFALQKSGKAQLPFALGILSSEPAGTGDFGVQFKRIPRTCAVFSSDARRFTINAAASAPYTATYQCCHARGVSTLHDTTLLPPVG